MMKTTVVIPNYNGIKYLEDCLESLGRCNGEFHIIVVDNGSVDGSLEIADRHPGVEVISLGENTGFASAVNRGIEASKTDYVLLLNNDITVEPDFVQKLEQVMDSDERLFSVNSRMLSMWNHDVLDGTGDYYCALGWAYAYGKGRNADSFRTKGCRIFSACGGASIYRKDILEQIGMFDEAHFAYLEDVDVGYRARIRGYYNLYEPSAVCYHAGSGSSGSQYNEFKIRLAARNSIYIIYKNMPVLQIIVNLPFLIAGFGIKALFFVKKGYGKLYIKSLGTGFAMCNSNRNKRVRFRISRLHHYLFIQLELWVNMFRRLLA